MTEPVPNTLSTPLTQVDLPKVDLPKVDLPKVDLPKADAPQITLVLPTYNESRNLEVLLARITKTFSGVAWEVIVVDDNSPDGTADLAKQMGAKDARIRCIRRVNRRGLAGACIEGFLASSAPYVGVMDADLQHDETILPQMLAILQAGEADLVIGSRHVAGGSSDAGFSTTRAAISRFATWLARQVFRPDVNDLMSGFFMMARGPLEAIAPALNPSGFKILADILASSPRNLRVAEVPYVFAPRLAGESKLDGKVALDFVGLLLNKLTRGVIPARFVFFALVGGTGLGIHLLTLYLLLDWTNWTFLEAEILATLVAMSSNFFVNNMVTYRVARRKGWAILPGLLIFYTVCSVGALTNIGAATWVYATSDSWVLAGFAGVLVASVWNYTLSSLFVWRSDS